jgi:hypothetical protein
MLRSKCPTFMVKYSEAMSLLSSSLREAELVEKTLAVLLDRITQNPGSQNKDFRKIRSLE